MEQQPSVSIGVELSRQAAMAQETRNGGVRQPLKFDTGVHGGQPNIILKAPVEGLSEAFQALRRFLLAQFSF
jgi:hypothetical protein